MKPNSRPESGAAVRCSAWLGVILCSLITCSAQMKQGAALTAEIAAREQRLESIHVSGLKRGILLVHEIVLPGSNPRTERINAQYPNPASLKSVRSHTLPENLALRIAETQSCLRLAALLGRGLISGPLLFVQIAPLGQEMVEQKNNEAADDSASNRGKNISDFLSHLLSGVVAVLTFIAGRRLLTPNAKLTDGAGTNV